MNDVLTNYINALNITEELSMSKELFSWKALMDILKDWIPNITNEYDTFVNQYDESGMIDGFNRLLKMISDYMEQNHQKSLNLSQIKIDTYDLVHDQNEEQLLTIIKLILYILINSGDKYINPMIELPEEEASILQSLWQDAMSIVDNLPSNNSDDYNTGTEGNMTGDNVGNQIDESPDNFESEDMYHSSMNKEGNKLDLLYALKAKNFIFVKFDNLFRIIHKKCFLSFW